MKTFTKTLRRLVTIRSCDPALPDGNFVVYLGPEGVAIRRMGESKERTRSLSWKSIVGTALIHQGR